MSTQKFMGRNELLKRLTEQMRTQKNPPKDPEAAARAVLVSRKMLTEHGALTDLGKQRDGMTAEERAIDRATKRTGAPASAFKYDAASNKAVKHKR